MPNRRMIDSNFTGLYLGANMHQDYIEKTRCFVIDNFLFGDDDGLSDDTSLMEAGIIDSTGILELIGFLEDSYAIEIADSEIVPQNMDNLRAIAGFLSSKLEADTTGMVQDYGA